MTRVLVIGLDALSPDLVERWLSDLPNIRRLMQGGIYGPLQSITQPITPAAWTAMISGRDPGHFGFTDFTYRVGMSYTDFRLVHSRVIRVPTLYSLLSEAGRRVAAIGVPICYPPVDIAGGISVACFMAPSLSKPIVSPPELQSHLLAQTSSPYVLDAAVPEQARDIDRDELLRNIREMDRQRFDITRHLMQTTDWDLLFMVAMGTDRVGHYFMRYLDPAHGRYDADPRYADAIRDHYRYCDERIGDLLQHAGPDTVVIIASDHGIQRLNGKVNLNQWLIENGYLHLDQPIDGPTPLAKAPIDWSRTRAWARGWGGQIYLNVQGREPQGCVPTSEVDRLLAELQAGLSELTTADSQPLPVTTIRRRDVYSGSQADRCPDLFVQFDELRYLTSDQLGHAKLITPITELGADDASHANLGFLAMAGPNIPALGRFAALSILDVAPTILDLLGVPIPPDLDGRAIHAEDDVYSDEDEAALTSRLRTLYLE
ncbi:MAG TPA: alkaline phosphatase family protein [Herpetosiphonaceae bacterium]